MDNWFGLLMVAIASGGFSGLFFYGKGYKDAGELAKQQMDDYIKSRKRPRAKKDN